MNTEITIPTAKKKPKDLLANLGLNIIIPSLLMIKGNGWFGFSPALALGIALTFPIGYGLFDFISRKKYNIISIVGFLSILMTGGIGLLELPKEWVAIKEAVFPLLLGILIIGSLKSRYPLIKILFYNDDIIDTEKVNQALITNNSVRTFDKLLVKSTYIISLSFLLSAILNFGLAKCFIQSETGTQAFNEELGKLTAWSYPVIAIPCMILMGFALWRLISGIKKLTGLDLEAIFRIPH